MLVNINLMSKIIALSLIMIGLGMYVYKKATHGEYHLMYGIQSVEDIQKIFPTSVAQINDMVSKIKQRAQTDVQNIIDINNKNRTFENTALALDRATAVHFQVPASALAVLSYVSPDDAIRERSNQALIELSNAAIDLFSQNVPLYQALKFYAEHNASKENLSDEQKYFLKEELDGFKREGLDLPEAERKKAAELKKKLSELTIQFDKNIADDVRSIQVSKSELAGLDEEFINGLEKTPEGLYILKTDYPTVFPVLAHAKVASTRKKMYEAFNMRAYPQNIDVLNQIIAVRDELAQVLGFESFAALNIDPAMAKTPERVREFLAMLKDRASKKGTNEFETLKKDLPESATLTKEGKFHPWDYSFVVESYKKKHFNLDRREMAKYFPLQSTIEGLLSIYEKFFDLTLKDEPISGLWADDLRLITVKRNEDQSLLGYIVLDMFPRPHKYTHACEISVVHGLKKDDIVEPALAVVLANFPKPTADRPSLLEMSDVNTFFHEFGHAIHEILGATKLASFAGTSVKTDFVEMPSQMLEEWLWDRELIKNMSNHYQTGEKIPDAMLNAFLSLKNFNTGHWVLRQMVFANMSLDYFDTGKQKDTHALSKQLHTILLPHVAFFDNNFHEASFGHLSGYGAKYYSYLWSKVFALDLFNRIKEGGLLNPEMGRIYNQKILSRGGSVDPNILLKDFLGREPNAQAFFKDLGL